MSGLMFIVIVPKKEHEQTLKKTNAINVIIETESPSLVSKKSKENNSINLKFLKQSLASEDSNIVLSKCKSTNNIKEINEAALFKSKSDNNLMNKEKCVGCDNKGYLKSSWEELKQIVRARRNKVNITDPRRGVDIVAAFHPDTPLENILSEVLQRLKIVNAAWATTKDDEFWQVTFSLQSSSLCEDVVQVLKSFGIGSRHHSSVCVIPCALYYQSTGEEEPLLPEDDFYCRRRKTAWSRFASSVSARNNLTQVLNEVRADAALTFDWLFLLIVAALVSAIGLVENSTVTIVASMLISPLMGPITAGTLGTAVKDKSLQHLGMKNELTGLLLTVVIGFIFGLCICAVDERYGVGDWPTHEMLSRCEIRSLWVGVLVAIPSGVGVALAVLGEYTSSLVGVAISASLLPPAVNAGVLWAMSLVHLIYLDDNTQWTGAVISSIYSSDPVIELGLLGTVSLCLTLVNIVCIFLAGVAVYKIKEVSPLEKKNIPWWKTNRNFLCTKVKDTNEHEKGPWELYSAWCNSPVVKKQETSPTINISDTVQSDSDTITYRRHKSNVNRAQMQRVNFDTIQNNFLQQVNNEHLNEYPPLSRAELATTRSDSDDSLNSINNPDSLDKDLAKKHNPGSDNDDPVNGHSTNTNDNPDSLNNDTIKNPFDRYSYKNTAFRGDYLKNYDYNVNDEANHYPTIEPSSNRTLDSKKVGLVLSSKTFDV